MSVQKWNVKNTMRIKVRHVLNYTCIKLWVNENNTRIKFCLHTNFTGIKLS
jgi:hypothetical protein